MKKILLAGLSAFALTTSIGVNAQTSNQYYAGFGVGSSKSYGINGDSGGVSVTGDSSKTSVKAFVGYQFTPNWGIEGQYSDLGNRTVTLTAGALNGSIGARSDQWSIAGTGTMPLSNGFALSGKLGVSRNHTTGGTVCLGAACTTVGASNKTDLLAGVGLSYSFSKQWAVRGEYEHFGKFSNNGGNGGSIKADNWAVSLVHSF